MPTKVRNVINLLVIFSLWKEDKHGYELIKEIEKKLGKKPSASQIYPFLQKLQDQGYVEIEKRGKRGKKVYSLTTDGRDFVESKMTMFSDIINATLEKDLKTCAHCGCKVYEGAHVEKIDGKKLAFCCKHCAHSYREHNL